MILKDHEIRELVSQLTNVAKEYGHTQQLRARIQSVIVDVLRDQNKKIETLTKQNQEMDAGLNWIANVNAMDYEYQKIAKVTLTKVENIL